MANNPEEIMPPEIEVAEGCLGQGAIVAEPFTENNKYIFAQFACPFIDNGESKEVYRSRLPIYNANITTVYLQQVKRLSESAISALCINCPNCPVNPQNHAPDDLSELDR